MKLNREEIIIGFIFGICFAPIIGLMCIPLASITSFLWALTGSESKHNSKLWRRLAIPLTACTFVYIITGNWYIWISLPLAFAVLSLGYSIPSTQPPDEGSTLGKFWYRISPRYANTLTRTTIYTLLLLAFLIGILPW